jgi:hypothetical protein
VRSLDWRISNKTWLMRENLVKVFAHYGRFDDRAAVVAKGWNNPVRIYGKVFGREIFAVGDVHGATYPVADTFFSQAKPHFLAAGRIVGVERGSQDW